MQAGAQLQALREEEELLQGPNTIPELLGVQAKTDWP